MKAFSLCIGLLLLVGCASIPERTDRRIDADLQHVIESFRTAIIDKDRQRFQSLILHEGITWQSVMDDATVVRAKAKGQQALKVHVNRQRTPLTFIESIIQDPRRSEERFSNIHIDADGDIAQVKFDYVFLRDGQESNRGQERWLLLRTDEGWKIASVVWSVVLP
jgi:hypothetical protein